MTQSNPIDKNRQSWAGEQKSGVMMMRFLLFAIPVVSARPLWPGVNGIHPTKQPNWHAEMMRSCISCNTVNGVWKTVKLNEARRSLRWYLEVDPFWLDAEASYAIFFIHGTPAALVVHDTKTVSTFASNNSLLKMCGVDKSFLREFEENYHMKLP